MSIPTSDKIHICHLEVKVSPLSDSKMEIDGLSAVRDEARDRQERAQQRSYAANKRHDRVRTRYSKEQRKLARALATTSCLAYTSSRGM